MPLWRMRQLFALVTFYFSFQGPHWPNAIRSHWLDDSKHECYWFSSTDGTFQNNSFVEGQDVFQIVVPACNTTTGAYQELILMELDLAGLYPKIPPEISLLEDLQYFHMFYNGAQGTLEDFYPDEIGQMTNLRQVGFTGNQLSGTLPARLAGILKLEGIYASDNLLTGTIPNQYYQHPELLTLFLHNNMLTGMIPGDLLLLSDGMPAMDELLVPNNQLSGTIPTEFGVKSDLVALRLDGNFIRGTIPSELGKLPIFVELGLSNLPTLTGTIPVDLAALTGLVHLTNSTGLIGEVPDGLCYLQESTCVYNYPWFEESYNCSLSFDCLPSGEGLCGCNCPC